MYMISHSGPFVASIYRLIAWGRFN